MAIVEISKSVFDKLPNHDDCRTLWPEDQEQAWYADTPGRVIGVLLHDPGSGLWGYSICQQDTDGQFRHVKSAADIPDGETARLSLNAVMLRL